MNYNALTRNYFDSAANVGELAGPGVFRGAAGNRAQGTWVQFDLQIKAGVIAAAKFLAFACPHTIAVAAWLAEQAEGRQVKPVLPESVQALRDRFAVPVEKMGRLLIIEDAWLAAARPAIDYRAHVPTSPVKED
jgi:NifU-like protein involved in Fe-S cluster formation